MVVLEVGRICMKIAGREAGRYCVVVRPAGKSKNDKSFVVVTGPRLLTGVKRRKSNIEHLKATEYKLEIADDAADEAVLSAYEKAGLIIKLGLKKPSAAQMKASAEKKAKKAEKAAGAKESKSKDKGKSKSKSKKSDKK
jgi:large subunit ribosomal protein L14e